MPESEMTARSVVPPPMSTTMLPEGSVTGRPAPIAATRACSTKYTSEAKGYRKWTFPLIVIGANAIFIYSVHQVLQGWLDRAIGTFTLRFAWLGAFAPVAQSCAVLLAMWYFCYWLYRRKIFFKL